MVVAGSVRLCDRDVAGGGSPLIPWGVLRLSDPACVGMVVGSYLSAPASHRTKLAVPALEVVLGCLCGCRRAGCSRGFSGSPRNDVLSGAAGGFLGQPGLADLSVAVQRAVGQAGGSSDVGWGRASTWPSDCTLDRAGAPGHIVAERVDYIRFGVRDTLVAVPLHLCHLQAPVGRFGVSCEPCVEHIQLLFAVRAGLCPRFLCR